MKRIKQIHLVGIGGSGMSGIAEVLINQGYQITGSDANENATVQSLQEIGATIAIGHDAKNIAGADVVVVSTAIAEDNPEVIAAHKKHIPVLRRAQMLGELMRLQYGIAVAGTHGKTTTTSLITSLLTEADLDPTFVIGGVLNSAGCHAKLGSSEYFVAEADESDASFLYLQPKVGVVTNIDMDHMGTYQDSLKSLKNTFIDFLHRLPLNGFAVMCIDDANVQKVLPKIARPVITYGFSDDADVKALDFVQTGTQCTFKVKTKDREFPVLLNLPGQHNVLNALAAITVALECDVAEQDICSALAKFQGVGRRFDILGEFNLRQGEVILLEDYGHHPREIEVTLEAMRAAWPDKRIVLAFQPHRYSRTQDLYDDFVKVLAKADQLIVLDIFPASEEPIPGISGEILTADIAKKSKQKPIFVKDINDIALVLEGIIKDNDVIALQGAGSVGKYAIMLQERFQKECV